MEKLKEEYLCENEEHDRFVSHGATTTLMGWTRCFDKWGRPLNLDPNTVTESYTCCICNKNYYKKTKGWNITWENSKHEILRSVNNIPDYIKERANDKK